MKTLRFSDLNTGQRVYIAEPGHPVLFAIVGKKRHFKIPYQTMSYYSISGMSDEDIIKRTKQHTELVTVQSLKDQHRYEMVTFPDGVDLVGINREHVIGQEVMLSFLNATNAEPHPVQDCYFDPNECVARTFTKLRRAEKYASRPKVEHGLESFMD